MWPAVRDSQRSVPSLKKKKKKVCFLHESALGGTMEDVQMWDPRGGPACSFRTPVLRLALDHLHLG